MGDVVWCPRCQNPVIVENMEKESRQGHCLTCVFTFCTQCQEPWHQVNTESLNRSLALGKCVNENTESLNRSIVSGKCVNENTESLNRSIVLGKCVNENIESQTGPMYQVNV